MKDVSIEILGVTIPGEKYTIAASDKNVGTRVLRSVASHLSIGLRLQKNDDGKSGLILYENLVIGSYVME